MLSGRKWTILLAFLGENGLFCALLGGKWTILAKIVDHFGHFWTMGKGGGGVAFAPLATPPPWLRAWVVHRIGLRRGGGQLELSRI